MQILSVKQRFVTKVELSNIYIGIIESLEECKWKFVTDLGLKKSMFSMRDLISILNEKYRYIQKINLGNSLLGPKCILELLNTNLSNLMWLNLSNNPIGNEGIKYVSKF